MAVSPLHTSLRKAKRFMYGHAHRIAKIIAADTKARAIANGTPVTDFKEPGSHTGG